MPAPRPRNSCTIEAYSPLHARPTFLFPQEIMTRKRLGKNVRQKNGMKLRRTLISSSSAYNAPVLCCDACTSLPRSRHLPGICAVTVVATIRNGEQLCATACNAFCNDVRRYYQRFAAVVGNGSGNGLQRDAFHMFGGCRLKAGTHQKCWVPSKCFAA
eukprot:gene11095-biopygen292